MPINLLELMQGAVGNQVIGKVADLIGVDEGSANKALGGALPALLGGLIGKVSTTEGADQLGAVLDQADGSILDNIGDILGGADGGSARLEEMGGGLISGLFGDKMDGIVDLICGVSGLDKSKVSSFLGMITPVIFSLLGKQKKGLGLDAAGFAKLLLGQKDILKGVLPPGLAGVLGLSGFEGDTDVAAAAENLKDAVVNSAAEKVDDAQKAAESVVENVADKVDDVKDAAVDKVQDLQNSAESVVENVADKVDEAKDAVTEKVEAVGASAEKAVEAAGRSGGGFMKFLVTLLVLGAIGFAVWKFVLPMLSKMDSPKLPAVAKVGDMVSAPKISPANALSTMTDVIAKAKTTLGGISDVPSAKAAIPEIEGMSKSVGAVGGMLSTLPGPVKDQIKSAVTGAAPQIKGLVEKAFAIPGVKAILEPKIDELFTALENFA